MPNTIQTVDAPAPWMHILIDSPREIPANVPHVRVTVDRASGRVALQRRTFGKPITHEEIARNLAAGRSLILDLESQVGAAIALQWAAGEVRVPLLKRWARGQLDANDYEEIAVAIARPVLPHPQLPDHLRDVLEQIRVFHGRTGMRPDWHEPDEQDVSAKVHGTHFNNAFGSELVDIARFGRQEFVVELRHNDDSFTRINLADLFALVTYLGGARV